MPKARKYFLRSIILLIAISFGIIIYKNVYLPSQLSSTNLETRTNAAITLALIWKNEEAIPVLVQSLIDLENISAEHNKKCRIALALLRIGQPAFGKLERILKSNDYRYTRMTIIQTILDIAKQKEDYLIPLLMIALEDNVRYHVSMASTSLAKIGSSSISHLIKAIIEKRLDGSKFGFFYAFNSLAMIKLKSEEFSEILPMLFEKIGNTDVPKKRTVLHFLLDTKGVNGDLVRQSSVLATLKEIITNSNEPTKFEIKAVLEAYGQM